MKRIVAAALLLALSACLPERTENTAAGDHGERLFRARCAICHGADGNPQIPMAESYPNMNLADGRFAHGSSREDIIRTITNGVPRTPMIGMRAQLRPDEIEAVADHVIELSAHASAK